MTETCEGRNHRSSVPGDLLLGLKKFVRMGHLLIALDFDGTLAPLVDDPGQARMCPEARAALLELGALPWISVALVSGRDIESLRAVSEPSNDWYLVGSHGAEIVPAGQRDAYRTERRVPSEIEEAFHTVVQSYPGTRVEKKVFGVALHTRGVSRDLATSAERAARQACESFSGELTIRTGHGILECSVSRATKADGIAALREATGAQAVFFAGDDTTDEDAITALGSNDLGIWVGPGLSSAKYRLAHPSAVAQALCAFAKMMAELST